MKEYFYLKRNTDAKFLISHTQGVQPRISVLPSHQNVSMRRKYFLSLMYLYLFFPDYEVGGPLQNLRGNIL